VELTRHAKIRVRERTKLSPEECQLLLDLSAYVYLGCNSGEYGITEYYLFLDPRSYQYFVACVRDAVVVIVMYETMQLPALIRRGLSAKNKKSAESYFYDRAAYRMQTTFRATLDVYLVIRRSRKNKTLHEIHLRRIDREGFARVKDVEVVDIFRWDIVDALAGKKDLFGPGHRISLELRQINDVAVRTIEYDAKDMCSLLVSDEVLYQTTVKVVSQNDSTLVPFGTVPATHVRGKVATILYFEEKIQEIADLLERRLSWQSLLHVEYQFHSVQVAHALPDRSTSIRHTELSDVFFNHTPK
jgi:hypothetical protein